MELWIRSQDKTRLTKVNDLYLVHDDNNFCDYIGNNMIGHLAKYTQQGRVLEVLDEIQNIIKIKFALQCDKESAFNGIPEKDINCLLHQCAVFDMPQE